MGRRRRGENEGNGYVTVAGAVYGNIYVYGDSLLTCVIKQVSSNERCWSQAQRDSHSPCSRGCWDGRRVRLMF